MSKVILDVETVTGRIRVVAEDDGGLTLVRRKVGLRATSSDMIILSKEQLAEILSKLA